MVLQWCESDKNACKLRVFDDKEFCKKPMDNVEI